MKILSKLINFRLFFALAAAAALILISHEVEEHSFWHYATHELGFALLIAVFVYILFEIFSRSEEDNEWNKRVEEISKSVFFGVFKRDFPQELINESTLLVLEQKFIRKDFSITYTIEDASYKDPAGCEHQFVRLVAVAQFEITNISKEEAVFPVAVGLPNPIIPEMKLHCKVSRISCTINENDIPFDREHASKQFEEKLKDSTSTQINYFAGDVKLKPGETAVVLSEYTMAKEIEDTEVLQTKYPADGLAITIVDRQSDSRVVMCRSIHRIDIDNITNSIQNGVYNFRIRRYLLPHQGFIIWWKRNGI